jgi:hypothetical protein
MKKTIVNSTQFGIGDIVSFNKNCTFGKKGETTIIEEVDYQGGGEFQYATTDGAWLDHDELSLVSKADKDSFKKLDELMHSDNEGDDEENE